VNLRKKIVTRNFVEKKRKNKEKGKEKKGRERNS